jgi:hypothetical protein
VRRAVVAGLLAIAAVEARAQQDTLEVPVLCEGQPISQIEVRTRAPFAPRDVPWYRAPLRVLEELHSTTDPSVVRRYLLLRAGQPCTERRLRETERLLRSYPFFASARASAYRDERGGIKVIVVTTDELTAVVDGTFRGSRPTSLTLGERNIGGTGTEVVGGWRDGRHRDGFGLAMVDHQFLGLPYRLDLVAERGDIGERRWLAQVAKPFLIEEQRRAWRATATEIDKRFPFLRVESDAPVELAISRRFYDVGGVFRLGPPGRLSLFGISFSREEDASLLPPIPDTTGRAEGLLARYDERRNARINALWGFRSLSFRQMERVDALTATQDIARGVQLGLLFGRSLNVLATADDDVFVASDLYIGAGNGRTFLRVDARGEGRQNYDVNAWDGILAASELSLYQLLGPRHTLQFDAEWSGGWRQRSPFQLTFGERQAGVRGYRQAREAGARRLVFRLEDRWLIDTFRDDADVAGAIFVDAGRLWAGDVPYGIDTPFRVGAGIGILAAVPSGSRRTYRLELAIPFHHSTGAGWEVRVRTTSVGLPLGWREPDDVARSRERAVPRSVF